MLALVIAVTKQVEDVMAALELLSLSTVLTGSHQPKPKKSTRQGNSAVVEAIDAVHPAMVACQKQVDCWNACLSTVFGFSGLPILDQAFQTSRSCIASELSRRITYHKTRAVLLDSKADRPRNTEYLRAVSALDDDMLVSLQTGVRSVARCIGVIDEILKEVLKQVNNPSKPKPPPTGMYN